MMTLTRLDVLIAFIGAFTVGFAGGAAAFWLGYRKGGEAALEFFRHEIRMANRRRNGA
jgi:hypothetical protein